MKHHKYNPDYQFVVNPVEFSKYSDKDLLKYCLGATMYMPGTKDFTDKILNESIPGLTSMVLCFEDACKEEDVPRAEENTLALLEKVADELEKGNISYENIPLVFVRVRNPKQFKNFASRLNKKHLKILAGINFPKFNSSNAREYFEYLKELNENLGDILYGMPIIEDKCVAFKETRMSELLAIKTVLDEYKDLVLQIRVGGTDFSSAFGVRRGVDYSIYDIMTVRECLCDILNIFTRENDYVVSGPVWEYFRATKEMKFKELPKSDINDCLLKREGIVNSEVDGLLREVILDKANGFIGRTVIHPTHLKYVNALMAVIKEEYDDACQILDTSGGVIKSSKSNKMNEIGPHRLWAQKVVMRAKAFGVIKDESEYIKLFSC